MFIRNLLTNLKVFPGVASSVFFVSLLLSVINRVADWTDSHGFRFSVEKSHTVLCRRTRRVFPEPFLTLYGRPLSVIHEVRFLGMMFDERLT